jgi:hypothetical protein
MSLQYKKTPQDKAREKSDLETSPVMRFLLSKEQNKFNIGDILIKQTRINREAEWATETVKGVGAPKKYMYVFENKLKIGYIKQLRVDGTGFTSNLICVANFDPDFSRFIIDPEFATHMLIGEDKFEYNEEYLAKKAYRGEAMKKNAAHLVNTRNPSKRLDWFEGLKVGDKFWYGNTYEEMIDNEYTVTKIDDKPKNSISGHIKDRMGDDFGYMTKMRTIFASRTQLATDNKFTTQNLMFTSDHFHWSKVSTKQPEPLSDPLCGRQK